MWIICQADDSHVMSSIIFSEKYEKHALRMSSASSDLVLKRLKHILILEIGKKKKIQLCSCIQRIWHLWSFYIKFMKYTVNSFNKFHMKWPWSVRFYLSYDCLKQSFIALKVEVTSFQNMKLSGMASWHYAPVAKCYVTCGHRSQAG